MDELNRPKRDAIPGRVDLETKALFEEVALPHLDAVYRVARALASNEVEAEELVQETYVRAFRAFSQFEMRDYGPRPWLLRILHNVFYSSKIRERRQPTLLDDVDFDSFAGELADAPTGPVSIDQINWDGFDEELKQAVAGLRPEYRVVLLLWAIEGLSYKEIAAVCGCALGTVMSRLYRTRRLLGRLLSDYAEERGLSREGLEP